MRRDETVFHLSILNLRIQRSIKFVCNLAQEKKSCDKIHRKYHIHMVIKPKKRQISNGKISYDKTLKKNQSVFHVLEDFYQIMEPQINFI